MKKTRFHELSNSSAGKRRTAQADSGLAGAFEFFHHGKYPCPFGLQFEALLGAGVAGLFAEKEEQWSG